MRYLLRLHTSRQLTQIENNNLTIIPFFFLKHSSFMYLHPVVIRRKRIKPTAFIYVMVTYYYYTVIRQIKYIHPDDYKFAHSEL